MGDGALVGDGFRSPVREPLEKVRGSISIQSYSQIDCGLRSRAAQNFWEIIPQTLNWKLAQKREGIPSFKSIGGRFTTPAEPRRRLACL